MKKILKVLDTVWNWITRHIIWVLNWFSLDWHTFDAFTNRFAAFTIGANLGGYLGAASTLVIMFPKHYGNMYVSLHMVPRLTWVIRSRGVVAFTCRSGRASLVPLLFTADVSCWAFITYNPYVTPYTMLPWKHRSRASEVPHSSRQTHQTKARFKISNCPC